MTYPITDINDVLDNIFNKAFDELQNVEVDFRNHHMLSEGQFRVVRRQIINDRTLSMMHVLYRLSWEDKIQLHAIIKSSYRKLLESTMDEIQLSAVRIMA